MIILSFLETFSIFFFPKFPLTLWTWLALSSFPFTVEDAGIWAEDCTELGTQESCGQTYKSINESTREMWGDASKIRERQEVAGLGFNISAQIIEGHQNFRATNWRRLGLLPCEGRQRFLEGWPLVLGFYFCILILYFWCFISYYLINRGLHCLSWHINFWRAAAETTELVMQPHGCCRWGNWWSERRHFCDAHPVTRLLWK